MADIIHCKDCKYREKGVKDWENIPITYWCTWVTTGDDDFCSYAQPKEEKEWDPVWIPYSLQKPPMPKGEKVFEFWGDKVAADEYIVQVRWASKPTSLFWTGKEWFNVDTEDVYDVRAWMPLPPAYHYEG